MLGDRALVEAVLKDYRTAPITAAERALLTFIEQVNGRAWTVRQEDVARVREAGWSDEAIFDALTVCALFNFYNRWVDAAGVRPMSEQGYRLSGQRLALRGYLMRPK